ncbi:unnamed protein product [Natator depressus]
MMQLALKCHWQLARLRGRRESHGFHAVLFLQHHAAKKRAKRPCTEQELQHARCLRRLSRTTQQGPEQGAFQARIQLIDQLKDPSPWSAVRPPHFTAANTPRGGSSLDCSCRGGNFPRELGGNNSG